MQSSQALRAAHDDRGVNPDPSVTFNDMAPMMSIKFQPAGFKVATGKMQGTCTAGTDPQPRSVKRWASVRTRRYFCPHFEAGHCQGAYGAGVCIGQRWR